VTHISYNYLYFVDTKNSVTYPTSPSERPTESVRVCVCVRSLSLARAWRKIELAKQRTVMVVVVVAAVVEKNAVRNI